MVVLNHNDAVHALPLLEAMERCAAVDCVLVADNSVPESRLKAERLPAKARLYPVENHGYARGNNDALHALENEGGSEYVIISNTDVVVSCEAIEACLGFLDANQSYALAAPRMLHADGTPHHLTGWREKDFLCDLAYSSGLLSRTLGIDREAYPPEYFQAAASDVDCVAGSFFTARLSMLREAGYFDPNTFLFFEEDILGFKLKRLGYKSAILNTVTFTHLEGASVLQSHGLLRRYRRMQRSRLYFHRVYKRDGPARMAAFYAATVLGICEKAIKSVWLRLRMKG